MGLNNDMTENVLPYVRDGEPPLQILQEETVFQEQGGADFRVDAIYALVRKTGQPITLHVTSVKNARPGAVCVAVRVDNNGESQYLLARHWRASISEWEWEFPRGMGEMGETAEQTAIRELREETGIAVDVSHVRILQIMHADTGVLRDRIAVVRISVPDDAALPSEVSSEATNDDDRDWELSHMRWCTARQMRQLICLGHIVDGITLAAFAIDQCNECTGMKHS